MRKLTLQSRVDNEKSLQILKKLQFTLPINEKKLSDTMKLEKCQIVDGR